MCPSLWTLVLLSGIVIGIYALVIIEVNIFFDISIILGLVVISLELILIIFFIRKLVQIIFIITMSSLVLMLTVLSRCYLLSVDASILA